MWRFSVCLGLEEPVMLRVRMVRVGGAGGGGGGGGGVGDGEEDGVGDVGCWVSVGDVG